MSCIFNFSFLYFVYQYNSIENLLGVLWVAEKRVKVKRSKSIGELGYKGTLIPIKAWRSQGMKLSNLFKSHITYYIEASVRGGSPFEDSGSDIFMGLLCFLPLPSNRKQSPYLVDRVGAAGYRPYFYWRKNEHYTKINK